MLPSRPHFEGRLISVSRRWAGGGGRLGALEMRRRNPSRRSKPPRPGAPTARRWAPLMAGAGNRSMVRRPRLGPQRWIGAPHARGRLKREVHRGRGGASLKHRARSAGKSAPRGDYACASKLKHMHRAAGLLKPRRSARPRRSREAKLECEATKKAYGVPGAAKNTGDDACLLHPPLEGEGEVKHRDE
jgi:hypothetical protein